MTIRRVVWRMGFRYRLHRKDLPYASDWVFVGKKKLFLCMDVFGMGMIVLADVGFQRSIVNIGLPKSRKTGSVIGRAKRPCERRDGKFWLYGNVRSKIKRIFPKKFSGFSQQSLYKYAVMDASMRASCAVKI